MGAIVGLGRRDKGIRSIVGIIGEIIVLVFFYLYLIFVELGRLLGELVGYC